MVGAVPCVVRPSAAPLPSNAYHSPLPITKTENVFRCCQIACVGTKSHRSLGAIGLETVLFSIEITFRKDKFIHSYLNSSVLNGI